MRIGFIGDLHIDYNRHHNFLDAIALNCQVLSLDYIVFCGDTTTGANETLAFYDRLSAKIDTKILEIPGNHELYCVGHKKHTPNICLDANEYMELMLNHPKYSLFRQPIVTNQWCIIGSPSWYDYSLHRNYLKMSRATKSHFLRRNPEYKYIKDSGLDETTNERITAKTLMILEKQLRTIRERQNGGKLKICSIIHMLPIAEMYKSSHIWGTTIAFMGSKYYSELYRQYGVDRCICAHSHIRKDLHIDGTHYVNVSLGHNFKWIHKTSLYKEIQDALYIMEI